MDGPRVTVERGFALGCGVLLLAAVLAWAAAGIGAEELARALGLGSGAGAGANGLALAPEAAIRARIAAMDAALRWGDRAGFVAAYAHPAAGEAAWAALGPVAAAATELVSLVPEGGDWREVSVLRVTAPPGALPARRERALGRLWATGPEGVWRIVATDAAR